jgi:predicted SprT family Zn-dependent metalloprotease
MILKCGCRHLDQDSMYGYEKRHHNKMVKDNMYRCSVCGKERSSFDNKEVKK